MGHTPKDAGLAGQAVEPVRDPKRLEEQREDNEENYRRISGLTSDFVHKCTRTGDEPFRIRWVGGGFTSIGGYTADEVIEAGCWLPFVHPDDRQPVAAHLFSLLPGDRKAIEFRLVDRQGETRWILETGYCTAGEREGELVLYGAASDITERKQAEEERRRGEGELRLAKERLEAMINALPDLMFRLDREGCIHEYHSSAPELLYITPDLFLGKRVVDVLPEDAARTIMAAVGEAAEKGSSRGAVYSLAMPGGEKRYELSLAAMGSPGKPETQFIMLARDITERERAREELGYVSECFRQALNDTQHVLYRLNVKKGCYDYISPEFEKITGHRIETYRESGYENVIGLIHPDDRPRILAAIDDAFRTRAGNTANLDLDYRFRKADGDYCWLHDSTTACFDDEGKLDCFFGSTLDVTRNKRAEELLRQSEGRYRRLVEQASAWIWEMDADLRHTFSNRFAESVFGYSLDEFRGMQLTELLHPDDAGTVERIVDGARNGKQGWQGVILRWHTKDGRLIYMESNGGPLFDEGGEFVGLSGVDIDVTARVLAEESLKNSEHSLRSIIDANPEPEFLIERDGTIVLANRSLAERLGRSVCEVQGRNLMAFGPPEAGDQRKSRIEEVFGSGKPQSFTDSQAGLELEHHLHPVIDQDGKVLRVAVLSIDVTVKNRLQRQLTNTQRLESLGVLAGGIAHDFNNILTTIMGNASLARRRVGKESPARENLQNILVSAERAADLAQQMLAYSGKGRFRVEAIDLNHLVEEMTHLLEVSISKKSVLRHALARPLPAIEADATQVRQIVMNLIVNASEAIGEEGGVITISTGCTACDREYLQGTWLGDRIPEGPYVFLEVADTGCGMDSKTLARIFDPFFSTKFTGRGLGLAAVLGIIKGHRGTVKISSEPGNGTTFRVLLPVSGKAAEKPGAEADEDDWRGEGKVLFVDDEERIRRTGSAMLEELGFTPVTAGDGREAVEIFRRNPDIAFVILDLTMPRMDGEECFRALRRLKPDVKVILSSGYSEHEVALKFAGKGVAGFVQKPYMFTALCRAIRRLGAA